MIPSRLLPVAAAAHESFKFDFWSAFWLVAGPVPVAGLRDKIMDASDVSVTAGNRAEPLACCALTALANFGSSRGLTPWEKVGGRVLSRNKQMHIK